MVNIPRPHISTGEKGNSISVISLNFDGTINFFQHCVVLQEKCLNTRMFPLKYSMEKVIMKMCMNIVVEVLGSYQGWNLQVIPPRVEEIQIAKFASQYGTNWEQFFYSFWFQKFNADCWEEVPSSPHQSTNLPSLSNKHFLNCIFQYYSFRILVSPKVIHELNSTMRKIHEIIIPPISSLQNFFLWEWLCSQPEHHKISSLNFGNLLKYHLLSICTRVSYSQPSSVKRNVISWCFGIQICTST